MWYYGMCVTHALTDYKHFNVAADEVELIWLFCISHLNHQDRNSSCQILSSSVVECSITGQSAVLSYSPRLKGRFPPSLSTLPLYFFFSFSLLSSSPVSPPSRLTSVQFSRHFSPTLFVLLLSFPSSFTSSWVSPPLSFCVFLSPSLLSSAPSSPFHRPPSFPPISPSFLDHLTVFSFSPPSLHPSIHLSDWSSRREDRCRANSS